MSDTPQAEGKCPVTGARAAPAGTVASRGADPADGSPEMLPPSVKLLAKREGLLSLARRSRRNILEVIPEVSLTRRIISGRLLRRFHIVTDPEANRAIFKTRIENYPKSPEAKGILQKALRHGLFVLDGDEWRWQRRALNPAFAPRNIKRLGALMSRVAEEGALRLQSKDRAVNISDEMMRTAFDVIVRVTFAGGNGQSAVPVDVVNDAIEHYLDNTGRVSILDYLGLPTWIPRPGRVRTHPTLKALKAGADAAIADRRKHPNLEDPALMDLLLDAEDPETGRKMTDEELRDNLITFLIAGHETTALTLTWALYLLAQAPEKQERASQEARLVLGARTATVDDLSQLGYVRQVLQEAMRLYPPIPMHLRTAQGTDTLCEHAVKKGDTVIVPYYTLHRHRSHWQDPDRFMPERFDDMSKIDRFAYVPFSVGPRVCIGAEFAMQESIIILATLLARFRFSPIAGKQPIPKLILTLRPNEDIWLNVEAIATEAAEA
jgi:cytochrome P450